MCGRTCCTLAPELLPFAVSKVTQGHHIPKWIDPPDGNVYIPATNVPPSKYTPIMYRQEQAKESERVVLQPMMWGLVPSWFKGTDPKSTGLSTINARIEGLTTSRLYKPLLMKNQRCVVVCDGFYEWKAAEKAGQKKQPYIIHSAQPKGVDFKKIAQLSLEDQKVYNEEEGWVGPNLLYMAGLYSVWTPKGAEDDQKVFSYTVITRDSNKVFSWLHNRIPAILSGPEAVQCWLDPNVEGLDALKCLSPVKEAEIEWYPVSQEVGNVRNQGPHLIEPVDLAKGEKPKSTKAGSVGLMSAWLGKKKESKSSESEGPDLKKIKKEEKD